MASFPRLRLRRLRGTETVRSLARETTISVKDVIYPFFVTHGRDVKEEIESMPGCYRLSLDRLLDEAIVLMDLGIPGVLLFGIPSGKDSQGSEAYDDHGIVQEAIRVIKQAASNLMIVTDVCLCEYTDHGHCGVVTGSGVDNDATLELLAKTALSHANAGADMVAPSAMMDGQVAAIREALDENGHQNIPIMGYSAKYASAFYGPFRDAAASTPAFGDRRAYQMDPASVRQALREVETDIEEGADVVMVKPAMAYLDVISKVRERYSHPIAAYNVSGEYSMVKAAAQNGWIDGDQVMMEILTSIKRAGADMIITYHAKEAARLLAPER